MKKVENKSEKISIAEAVRFVISKNQSYLECLSKGLVNYTWLAESIKDEVLLLTGRKKINIDAIKAALIRYEEELKKEQEALSKSIDEVLSRSTFELQNDISVLTINKYSVERKIKEILEVASRARFFNFTQGKKTYTIVISSEDVKLILSAIDKEDLLDRVDGQSALIIISPYEIMTTPGVINYITRLMYIAGINLTQIMSCYTDTILIIDKSNAIKALKLIQDVIEQQRLIESTKKGSQGK